jgi:hypothetical protein
MFLHSKILTVGSLVLLTTLLTWLYTDYYNTEHNSPEDQAAVTMFLEAAESAVIYKQETGSFANICESTDNPTSVNLSLLLKVKQLGAAEVYCTNSDNMFMAEALLPSGTEFFCIDSSGNAHRQPNTNRETAKCSAL